MLLLGLIFLLLLIIGVHVVRQPSFLSFLGFSAPPPQPRPAAEEDENASIDFLTVAALAIEETTSGKFRSGGLGLARTAWEVLRGQPERPSISETFYQGKTYRVTYQQERVWQIDKSWGEKTPTVGEARSRVRRYLPLDSSLAETIAKSDQVVVDVYRSHMLAQLLAADPIEPVARKGKRRKKELPTERCVVVHRLRHGQELSYRLRARKKRIVPIAMKLTGFDIERLKLIVGDL
ncbi:MAG: hypothetical protein FJ147_19975 [Deltaproteobacteria bacterium]|nr:hypothetical protein [Deltaproteobacteria bacterium]